MEILQSQDPEKKRLMEAAQLHKEALAQNVQAVSERTQKIMTNALVIGGALALTYLLVSQLSGGKSKKKKSKTVTLVTQAPAETAATTEAEESDDSLLAQIGTKIINEATVILLNLAKEKLSEYLNSGKQQNENS
jgi:hypothetical protein